MSSKIAVVDRLKQTARQMTARPLGPQMAHFLSPASPEDLERRRADLLALLLVAIASSLKLVTGLTDGRALYTMYGIAITVAAVVGGTPSAAVAAMAAVLLAGAAAPGTMLSSTGVLFALECAGLAVLVGEIGGRLRAAASRVTVADGRNNALARDARRARISHDAFQHLEEMASDAAVFVVNAQGLIIEWPRSASRMYGFTAEQMLGSDASVVLGEPWRIAAGEVSTFAGSDADPARRAGIHRRSDGSPLHVEFAVRPCGDDDGTHFAVSVQDQSRRREMEAFREAALRAQTALQRAADEAHGQLETLEALTDPTLNVVAGVGAVDELLDRLRSALRAEGIALVQVGRTATRVVAAAGLRPAAATKSGGPAASAAGDGRLALVHNDPARVAQVSAVQWPATASSIVVVPVCHTGPASFRIEVVNERRATATEWDLALARIVADRLASAMLLRLRDSADAVA